MKRFFKPYSDLGKAFQLYWTTYGGLPALLKSPYFHVAILFTTLSRPWLESMSWVEDCLSVVPSILGFSLGAFAIFLAFSDSGFLSLMTARLGRATEKSSLYMQLSAAFAHFMMVQTVAIGLALIGRNVHVTGPYIHWGVAAFAGLGYFFFIYALLTVIATAFMLLRFASAYDKYRRMPPIADDPTSPK